MSMKQMLRGTIAAASLASAAACGPTIRSDRDEAILLPHGATWAWGVRDTTERSDRGPALNDEIVQQRFRRAIEGAMQAKGFRQADDPSQADFLLTFTRGIRGAGAGPGRVMTAAGVGFYGGWGYHPWGWYGPRGFYRPWGFYQPWGWGYFGAPVWGGFVTPMYPAGYRSYGESALVAVLRQRSTGDVAWRGRVASDVYDTRRLSQERVQEIVNKLFEDLR
jgi:hypothetical protein